MTAMIVAGIDPASGTIDAAIITLEGLVVFDATLSRNGMQVHRALPPLNRRRFATRLIRDIRFIFGIHASQPAMTGFLDDGASVCRYHDVLNSTVDMGVQPDGVRYVEQYSRYGKKLRSLKMHALHNDIPAVVQYTAFSPKQYALSMRLLSVEAFVPDDHNQECKDMQ